MDNPFQEIHQRLDHIEQMILELKDQGNTSHAVESDAVLNTVEAAKVVNLAVDTVYRLSSLRLIPVNKKGNRLYFSKNDLLAWIKSGKKMMMEEIKAESVQYIRKRKAQRG